MPQAQTSPDQDAAYQLSQKIDYLRDQFNDSPSIWPALKALMSDVG